MRLRHTLLSLPVLALCLPALPAQEHEGGLSKELRAEIRKLIRAEVRSAVRDAMREMHREHSGGGQEGHGKDSGGGQEGHGKTAKKKAVAWDTSKKATAKNPFTRLFHTTDGGKAFHVRAIREEDLQKWIEQGHALKAKKATKKNKTSKAEHKVFSVPGKGGVMVYRSGPVTTEYGVDLGANVEIDVDEDTGQVTIIQGGTKEESDKARAGAVRWVPGKKGSTMVLRGEDGVEIDATGLHVIRKHGEDIEVHEVHGGKVLSRPGAHGGVMRVKRIGDPESGEHVIEILEGDGNAVVEYHLETTKKAEPKKKKAKKKKAKTVEVRRIHL